jgi:hypothetical protein
MNNGGLDKIKETPGYYSLLAHEKYDNWIGSFQFEFPRIVEDLAQGEQEDKNRKDGNIRQDQ